MLNGCNGPLWCDVFSAKLFRGASFIKALHIRARMRSLSARPLTFNPSPFEINLRLFSLFIRWNLKVVYGVTAAVTSVSNCTGMVHKWQFYHWSDLKEHVFPISISI